MLTQRGSARRRFAATKYVVLALAGLLAAYVLTRATQPERSGDLPSCTDPWGANAKLLEELRRSPACGAARPGQRCCALSAEASAGRCYCRPGDYLGIGTALASMQERCRSPPGAADGRAPLDQRLQAAARAAAQRGSAMPGSEAVGQENRTGAGLGEALVGAGSQATAHAAELGDPESGSVLGLGSATGLGSGPRRQRHLVLPHWVRGRARADGGKRVQAVSGHGSQVRGAGAGGKPQADDAAHEPGATGRGSGAQQAGARSRGQAGGAVREAGASDRLGAGESGISNGAQPDGGTREEGGDGHGGAQQASRGQGADVERDAASDGAALARAQHASGAAAAAAGSDDAGGAQGSGVSVKGRAGSSLGFAGARDASGGASAGREAAPLLVFVGVLTAAANTEARAAIRATWGADQRLRRVLFVSAKPADGAAFAALRQEAAAEGDVALLPHVWEGYANITHQTLEVLRAAALDPDVTHVLKVDDDSYVRVGPLLDVLAASPRRRLFLGWIDADPGGPHRDPSHPWHVPRSEWAADVYPRWAHGAGYVLTQDLVREVAAGAALAAGNHSLFRLEDVAVGSWVAYVAAGRGWQVRYASDTRFNYNGCAARDIVSHYVKPAAARCMFAAGGRCCKGDGAGLARV